jgi:hypothetical protein
VQNLETALVVQQPIDKNQLAADAAILANLIEENGLKENVKLTR